MRNPFPEFARAAVPETRNIIESTVCVTPRPKIAEIVFPARSRVDEYAVQIDLHDVIRGGHR